MQSFSDIRQIILEKIVEIERQLGGNTQRIEEIEQQITDVGQKYEQFQELFATLISEMQSASEAENEDKMSTRQSFRDNMVLSNKSISPNYTIEDPRGIHGISTQMSQSSPMRIDDNNYQLRQVRSRNDETMDSNPSTQAGGVVSIGYQ